MQVTKQKAVFPGSFCPPTYGHLEIVKRACNILGPTTIICSRDGNKEYLFTPEECKKLWLSYDLPKEVQVLTFDEFSAGGIKGEELIMIRGMRSEADFKHEKAVMEQNYADFRIRDYQYLLANEGMETISATGARAAAENLDLIALSQMVSPMVVTALLEKTLGIKNFFLVVGKPGSGKSTLLKDICTPESQNVWIETDSLSKQLRPLLKTHFKGQDLVKIAAETPDKITKVIAEPWLRLLSAELARTKGAANVFVEVGYGLTPGKELYRYLGGKIIFIDCEDEIRAERLATLHKTYLQSLSDLIPNLEQSREIANSNKLEIIEISSEKSVDITKLLFESL